MKYENIHGDLSFSSSNYNPSSKFQNRILGICDHDVSRGHSKPSKLFPLPFNSPSNQQTFSDITLCDPYIPDIILNQKIYFYNEDYSL